MKKSDFVLCKVTDKIIETENSVSLILKIPESNIRDFEYKPGQYLTLKKNINGEEVRRSYSLSSAPHQGYLRVGVKKVIDGKFSSYIHDEVIVGDEIEIMPPTGNFLLDEDSEEDYFVFFAAGSGITPILSMIIHLLAKTEKKVILFYGNKGVEKIMYREELESLKNTYLDRLIIHHIFSEEKLGSPLFLGRIDGDKCKNYHDHLVDQSNVAQYLICGPAPMIFDIESTLLDMGVDGSRIRYELFTTADLPDNKLIETSEKGKQKAKQEQEGIAIATIKMDGIISTINIPFEGKTILDMAIEEGLDAPFSCKGGVCSTCKAKLEKGQVKMQTNYALEEDEVKEGYILTCQSHPLTEEIYVDYDQG